MIIFPIYFKILFINKYIIMKFLCFSMSLLFLIQCQTDDPLHTALLYGSSDLGYYYVNIYVGSPP